MLKTLVAYTNEVDDVNHAIKMITAQLDIQRNIYKNAIGIITCHYEFIDSGVVKALCEALPFDIVGTTSILQGTNNESGMFLLTLMVLTSDDISFTATLSPPLLPFLKQSIETAYKEAVSQENNTPPSLLFVFAPVSSELSGDNYVDFLSQISDNVPCFGTLAVDDTSNFENCYMIFNGEHYRNCIGLISVFGNISPRFFIAMISPNNILENGALVTKSEGPILKGVNGRPAIEYFENLGLAEAIEERYSLSSLPIILDYNDGSPQVSKVFISITADNDILCAGTIPEGSTMNIGVFNKDDVLYTTGQAVEDTLEHIENASCMLVYSCITRSVSLDADVQTELDLVKNKVEKKLPFMMAYSNGEICPTKINNAKAINRFHNNALIICLL